MNYFGKYDAKDSADALGLHAGGHVHTETVHATRAPSDAIIVSDVQLLFGGEFKRSGVDLILSGDHRELVLHEYFKGEKRATLSSPDGAHLSGDLVTALAGQVQYAQADGTTTVHQVIGHVTKLVGNATAIRNGVSIILNNGDNVEKGDVVASGSDSTVGITFIDGSVFGLSSNARMVLNEMVYDPNGSNNSSLLSLVAGTITFVAGETAKHGDMKVDTPVATMGIRGTAVLFAVHFKLPNGTIVPDDVIPPPDAEPEGAFQVLIEPDGTTGSYILFDKTTLTPFRLVDVAGLQINIANGIMSQTASQLSPEVQKLISDVFTLKFSDSSNTKSLEHFTDTIVPLLLTPFKIGGLPAITPTIFLAVTPPQQGADDGPGIAPANLHLPFPPVVVTTNDKFTELPSLTASAKADKAGGTITFFDINPGDQPSVSANFDSFTYKDANGIDVTKKLSALQLADIKAVEAALTIVQDPAHKNFGTATWSYSVADGSFDFLAAGETLTLTYNAIVDNEYQPNDLKTIVPITITITGTNDAPKITTSQQNISFSSAGTDTQGGLLFTNTAKSGALTFTDTDLTDTHNVGVQMTSALLNGKTLDTTIVGQARLDAFASAVSVNLATDSTGTGSGKINWTLADLEVFLADFVPANESLVLTYTVTVTDVHAITATDPKGVTSTQNIVVTISGNNSPTTVWIDTNPIPPNGAALWSDAANWETDKTPTSSDDTVINNNQVNPAKPTFPVTVDDTEAAKSLTMTDFDGSGIANPRLIVTSSGNLTTVGALNLDPDVLDPATSANVVPLTAKSIIDNFGKVTVGGFAELLKDSVLNNSGTFILKQGGDFGGNSSITNTGTIEVVGGNTANSETLSSEVNIVQTDINTVATGTIQLDAGAALALSNGVTVTNGAITLASLSALDVESKNGATLDGVVVTGVSGTSGSTIEIGGIATPSGSILTLDDGTSITNGNMTIAAHSTLDVESTKGATLDGVAVTGTTGTLAAGSTIEVGTTTTSGTVLTLESGTTVTNGNLVIDAGNTLDVENPVTGNGATLNNVHVTNNGTIQVDGSVLNSTTVNLVLKGGTTIDGGKLIIHDPLSSVEGTVEIGTGGATFDNVTVKDNNSLTIDSGVTLTLDDGTSVTGGKLVFADSSAKTFVGTGGATLDGVAVTGGGEIDVGSVTATGVTLRLDDGASVKNGKLVFADSSDKTFVGTGGATLDGIAVTGGGEIDVGSVAATGVTLTLDDGASVKNGKLVFADSSDKTFVGTGGATLDGVAVTGGGEIDVGSVAATGVTLTLDDGTTITNGNLTIAGGSTLDVEAGATGLGATLDGVNVTGTNAAGADLIVASTIEVGTTTPGAAILVLDDGTTITHGELDIAQGSKVEIEAGANGGGATLNDVQVTGPGTIQIDANSPKAVNLVLEGGTTVTSATIVIHDPASAADGTLEIGAGGATLDSVTVTNNSKLTVDGSATLKLSGNTSITGGTVDDDGTLEIAGANSLNGVVTSNGSSDLILQNDNPNGRAAVVVDDGATLTLDHVAAFSTDFTALGTTGSIIQVDNGFTLGFDGDTLTGGTLNVLGRMDSNFTSSITNTTIVNSGTINIVSGALTIDPSPVTNTGTIDVQAGATLVLQGETIANSATNNNVVTKGKIEVDGQDLVNSLGAAILDLQGSTITGGTMTLSGVLFADTGDATLDGVTVTGGGEIDVGSATVTGVTLTLDDKTSVTSGTLVFGDSSDKALIGTGGATLDGVAVTGGGEIDVGSVTATGVTLTLDDGASVKNGKLVFADSSDKTFVGAGGATLDGVAVTGGGEIDVGSVTATGVTLTLDDGASVKNGKLVFADSSDKTFVGAGGATLDGVAVTGGGEIDVGSVTATGVTLTLDDGASVKNGKLVFADSSDKTFVGAGGATLDGVAVTGGGEIDVGSVTATGVTLTLDDGASVKNGKLVFADSSDKTFVGKGGATLDGVAVTGGGEIDVGSVAATGVTLTLDDGASVKNGKLVFADSSDKTFVGAGGATLDGVAITGGGEIDVGSVAATGVTLTLDDGASVKNGKLVFGDSSDKAFVGKGGATLDGVTVSGGGEIDVGSQAATGVTLTLDDNASITSGSLVFFDSSDSVSVGAGGATLDGVAVSGGGEIDVKTTGVTLTLDDNASITNGKLVFGDSSDSVSVGTGGATLDGVTVSGGGNITIDSGSTLTLDHVVTINGIAISGGTLDINGTLDSEGISSISGTTIVNSDHIDVVSGKLTIDPAPFTNTGTIDVQGTSTLVISGESLANNGTVNNVPTNGLILVESTVNNHATLDLDGSTISGGTLTINGELVSTGPSEIDGAIINNTGTIDVTSGTLIIDSASTLNNSGTLETNGGNLIINTTFSGSLEIQGDKILELGANSSYSGVSVTFDPDAAGTLKLDHSEAFKGTVAGLDDNKIDLVDISSTQNGNFVPPTVTYSGDNTGGTLTVVSSVDPSQVALIKLTGDYTGVTWSAVSDGNGGTNITEIPGVISGLTNGNAVEGTPVSVSITDGGAGVTQASYQWQLDGKDIANATNATYLPTENDEGHALTVNVTYTDALNNVEPQTIAAGTVQESPSENASIALTGLTSGNAVEGQQITASVTEADAPSSGITYTWTVNGQTVHTGTDTSGSTYTPTEADEGQSISVAVSFTDTHGFAENGTTSAGTVQESPSENASIALTGLTSGNAVEGQQITASVTEADAPSSGITYTWTVNGQTVHTGTDTSGSTYTPTEADEGQSISVAVSFTDTHGFAENGTTSAGTVQESPSENASIALTGLTSGNAVEGQQITASVTEADAPSSGITYTWTVNGQTVHTGTDTSGSTYTPTEADEGQSISVAVSFTDTHGFAENGTTSAGTVQESPSENASIALTGLTSGNAVEGQQITASVTEADAPSSGITYTWTVNGQTVHTGTDTSGSTYTPTEADEGQSISVAVSFTDTHGFAENGTTSAGTVQESPSENASIALTGLTSGNAVEGQQITASVTEADAPSSGITYTWTVNGQTVHTGTDTSGSTYTPTEADEGQSISVAVSFTDTHGFAENGTTSAGTVQESPSENASIALTGLTSGNAVEGQQITASVTEADAPSSGITYTWTVNGQTVHTGTDTSGSTYTPTEADEGQSISVAVSFTDTHGFAENGTTSAGTVQESPSENASIALTGLTSGNAVEGQQITASVTEADAPSSGITYTWTVNGQTVHTGTDTSGSTYTPTEADEGQSISVAVSFTDTHGFAENGTTSAGTVQESPSENASIALTGLTSGNAVEGQQITASVTEADAPSSGITYTWTVNGQTVHTGTDTSGSTYTPTEADEGQSISVAVSFTDTHGFAENGTTSAGTVQESPSENASIALTGLTSGNAVEGQQITASVTEADAPSSGITYTWTVNGQTVHTGTDTSGSTYTPTEADEGQSISVAVSFTDTHGFAENGTTSAGTVAAPATPTVTITALTTSGLDLTHQDPFADIGGGAVQSHSLTSYTVLDSADQLSFTITGNDLHFDGNNNLTSGTITSFEEFSTVGNAALGNFTGFNIDAVSWASAVQADAHNDPTAINALTAGYEKIFVGNSGNDGFGARAPAHGNNTYTGGAGKDIFQFTKGDGAVTITDFDQTGSPGTVNSNEGDTIVLSGFGNDANPTFTSANGNTVVNFGGGDVLTLLGVADKSDIPNGAIIENGNGGGNNGGGPVQIGNGNNTVMYTGTPVTLEQGFTISDSAGTISSINAWISPTTEQSTDKLTINGTTSGTLTYEPGVVISYNYDSTPNTAQSDGHGMFLQSVGTTAATIADFEAAMQLIQYSSTSGDATIGGTDPSRTITWAASDGTNFSPTVTTTVVFSQLPVVNTGHVTVIDLLGGPGVTIDPTITIADPESANLTGATVTIANVQAGDTLIFANTSKITGTYNSGVLTLSGTDTVADYQAALQSISFQNIQTGASSLPRTLQYQITDATTSSAVQTSTVEIGVPPLVAQNTFGSAGKEQGAAVTYADGHLYLSYNNGAEAQDTSDNATIVAFNTSASGASQTFTYAWGKGDLFGIAADAGQIYTAGESNPGFGLTSDNNGGVETKSIFVRFDADGTAGSGPAPALGHTSTNFYSYQGVEQFSGGVIASTQSGNTVLYAFGSGQPQSFSGYLIGEYSSSGTLLASAEDQGGVPGGSSINAAADWKGAIWAVGNSQHGSETFGSPIVWTFSYNLGSVTAHEDNIGGTGSFNGVTTIGNELYAVGAATGTGGLQNYLIAEYNADGSVAWNQSFGAAGANSILSSAVELDGHLYVVGSTTNGVTTEGVLMEINPQNGSVISTTVYDQAQYNSFTSITTDGKYLYVAGVSGANVTQDQAVLLTYNPGVAVPHVAPVVTAGATALAGLGGPAVAIDPTLTVTDSDSTTLVGATVSIKGFQSGFVDVLNFTNTAHITGSFNTTTGILTLTGSDTVANYQAALQSVTFSTPANAQGAPRTIVYQVNDGAGNNNFSAAANATVNVASIDHWKTAVSANWTTAGDWTTGVPTSAQIVDIDPTSASYNVTVSSPISVAELNLVSKAALSVSSSGTLTLTGTGTSDIAGTLSHTGTVSVNAGTLEVDGFLVNGSGSSTINIASGAVLAFNGATAQGGTLNDSGTVEINGATTFETGIQVNGTGVVLIANGATLSLATTGAATDATFNDVSIINSGAIDITSPNGASAPLVLSGGTSLSGGTLLIDNLSSANTLEISGGTGGSGATLSGVTVTNEETLLIDASVTLALNGGTSISGGTINDKGTIDVTGVATITGGAIVNGSAFSSNGGTIKIENGQTLTLGNSTLEGINIAAVGTGTIDLTGTVNLHLPPSNGSDVVKLTSANSTLVLDGSGTLALGGGSINSTVAGATLENNGATITGSSFSQIGNGAAGIAFNLVNLSGTIEASGGELALRTHSDITNSGLLKADAGASLALASNVINNGTSPLAANNPSGILVNGTLFVNASDLVLKGNGQGVVEVNGGIVDGVSLNLELENFNNTIMGYGQIGNGTTDKMTLVNDSAGIIDANVSGHTLSINTTTNVITNAGLIEATAGGNLSMTGATVANTGTIKLGDGGTSLSNLIVHNTVTFDGGPGGVLGTGNVNLANGDIVSDLTPSNNDTFINADNTISGYGVIGDSDLTVQNFGLIDATGGLLTLSAASITNTGLMEATTGGTLDIKDAVNNSGLILANGGTVIIESTASIAANAGDYVSVANGGTAELVGANTGISLAFYGAGTVKIDQPHAFNSAIFQISGSSDTIDLGNFGGAGHVVTAVSGIYDAVNNLTSLVVTDTTPGGSSPVTLELAGNYLASTWLATSDGHGGTNVVDQASPLVVGAGQTLEVSSAAAHGEGISFQDSHGTLIIDNPSTFNGLISGFTGDGSQVGSDQIDLKGIAFSGMTESFNQLTQTLTVSSGGVSESLTFFKPGNNLYVAANFKFTHDDDGNVVVYDPPAPGQSTGGITMKDPGPAPSIDNFAFDFKGPAPPVDNHVNAPQFNQWASSNVQSPWHGAHDGSLGTGEAHDSVTPPWFVKAHLHTGDFHVG